jgi:hypothetical protein
MRRCASLRGVLGMEKRKDLSRSEGERYIEVAPPGSPVALSPYTHYDQEPGTATIGEYSPVVLRITDVRTANQELTAQRVRFEREPVDLPRVCVRSRNPAPEYGINHLVREHANATCFVTHHCDLRSRDVAAHPIEG